MLAPRRFRPTLWPTLFTVPALVALIGLGLWQLDRLQWKSALIEMFEERVSAVPLAPPDAIGDITTWRYRRIVAEGEFLHDREVHITGKPFEGSAGFHVLTPLRMPDDRILIVNRGWVPDNRRSRSRRPETVQAGRVMIEGILREDRRRGYFVPDNEPVNDIWLYIDTAEIAAHRQLGPVLPYYIDAIRDPERRRLPVGASTAITVRNEHLQYAITWFLLAVALAVIYIIYHYRRPDEP